MITDIAMLVISLNLIIVLGVLSYNLIAAAWDDYNDGQPVEPEKAIGCVMGLIASILWFTWTLDGLLGV